MSIDIFGGETFRRLGGPLTYFDRVFRSVSVKDTEASSGENETGIDVVA